MKIKSKKVKDHFELMVASLDDEFYKNNTHMTIKSLPDSEEEALVFHGPILELIDTAKKTFSAEEQKELDSLMPWYIAWVINKSKGEE